MVCPMRVKSVTDSLFYVFYKIGDGYQKMTKI
jgi:hypothetical protein